MFIELVDVLRCPNAHEETWLVLAAHRMKDRDVTDGTLGCPVCKAEFPIRDGIARFDQSNGRRTQPFEPDESEALRIAALLSLTDPRGYAILAGEAGSQAPRLRELTDVQLLLIDPPADVAMGRGISGLTANKALPMLPLAHDSARAIAFDDSVTANELEARLPVVSVGGRILAPVGLPLPAGVTELARDERHWLAERTLTLRPSRVIAIEHRR